MAKSDLDLQLTHFVVNSLEGAKAQVDNIVDTLPGLLAIIDQEGRFFRANLGLAHHFGVKPHQLYARTLEEIFDQEEWRQFKGFLHRLHPQKNRPPAPPSIFFELEIIKKNIENETPQIYLWSVSLFDYPGKDSHPLYRITGRFIGKMVMFQRHLESMTLELEAKVKDRTKKLESQQERMLMLAHSSGMGQMAAQILHTLGNALVSMELTIDNLMALEEGSLVQEVKSYSQYLEKNIQQKGNFWESGEGHEVLQYFSQVHHLAQEESLQWKKHLVRLSQSIEKMSKIIKTQEKYTRVEPFNEKFRINSILDDAHKLIAERLRQLQITWECQNLDNTHFVSGQRNLLLNALLFILTNSYEALRESRAKEKKIVVKVECSENQKIMKLIVSDNGVGIASNQLNKVFVQGHSTKTNHAGLGLHTASLMLESMGTKIAVDSLGPHQGTTVSILIPLEQGH